jgi:tripartite-type tricarboxylate transporter receptor subunit TctC
MLHDSYVAAAGNPEIVAKLNGAGIDVLQSTPAEFADYMRSETEKWATVVRTANIRAD